MQFKSSVLKSGETSIKFIRWAYDPKKGRAMPKCLGTVKASWEQVPAYILNQCTPEERVIIDEFWSANRVGVERDRLKRSAHKFLDIKTDIVKGVEQGVFTSQELGTLSKLLGGAKRIVDDHLKMAAEASGAQMDPVEHIETEKAA